MHLRLLLGLFLAVLWPATRAAAQTDVTLATGLQACNVNDLRTCIRTWYAHDPVYTAQLQTQLDKATQQLGDIVGSEIVQTRDLGKRVRRYYIALYYQVRPLWLRVDRYNSDGVRQITLPLKYSVMAEEILPRELTGE